MLTFKTSGPCLAGSGTRSPALDFKAAPKPFLTTRSRGARAKRFQNACCLPLLILHILRSRSKKLGVGTAAA